MPKFVFKLDPVLEQRLRTEREHQRVVAELERDRLELEGEIRSCQGLIDEEKHDLRAQLEVSNRIDLRAARMQAGASLHLVARAQRAVLQLAGVHARLGRARAVLLEAAKARKAVELLRDRRYEQWLLDQRKGEDAFLDELSVTRHGRHEGAL